MLILEPEGLLAKDGTFRDGAVDLLQTLQRKNAPAYIVVDSDSSPVLAMLRMLAMELGESRGEEFSGQFSAWWLPRVYGQARKLVREWFLVGSAERPTQSLAVPGLETPIYLDRRHYYDVLNRIRGGRPWSEMVVIGEDFQLDLALPLVLGARVGLTMSDKTPSYASFYLRMHLRGHILSHAREILPFYKEVT